MAFYRDVLGMKFLFEVPGQSMAFFDCGGIRLLLGRPEGPEEDHPGSILYFTVDDIRAAHGVLEERDVAFIRAPEKVADLGNAELWLAFFRDPWDNTLALMSEVPKTG